METNGVGSTSSSSSSNSSSGSNNEALRGLDLDQFLKLMITEMQNQDPLNPMDNSEILQQITQIREIEATQRLKDTLDAISLGQGLSAGSGLIGRKVRALADDGKSIQGVVDRVTLVDGSIKVHIGDSSASLKNVSEVLSDEADALASNAA